MLFSFYKAFVANTSTYFFVSLILKKSKHHVR